MAEANRTGKATEYKKGHYYLTQVEWEDGHVEIEIHSCCPVILYHSCDKNDFAQARAMFEKLGEQDPKLPPLKTGGLIEGGGDG